MLERPHRTCPRIPFRAILLLLIGASLLLAFVPVGSRADIPSTTENPDATRTVTWAFNDTAGFNTSHVAVGGGRAELAWNASTLHWTKPGEFVANGTLDRNLTTDASGLSLAANWSNRLVNGTFGSGSLPWAFANGSTNNVSAIWEPAAGDALLGHRSPSTLALFDAMDNVTGWNYSAGGQGNITGGRSLVHGGQIQGTGMIAIDISSWTGVGWAALLRGPGANWSAVDRLVLWLNSTTDTPVAFNLTAHVGSNLTVRSTSAQAVGRGWQRISVDLGQLGTAVERRNVVGIQLQINGNSVPPNTHFYFDDLEVGRATVFNETASVSQSFLKTNSSSSAKGSAFLSFDWALLNASGISWYAATASVGSWQASVTGPPGLWTPFLADVSSPVASAGKYTVNIALQVRSDSAGASNISFHVDNVSFVYPDRHNGTYLSHPLSWGADSQFVAVSWAALASPPLTQVSLSLRAGNASGGGSYAWSGWEVLTSPGPWPLTLPGSIFLQIRADLETQNASASPVLQSVTVSLRHRELQGAIMSAAFTAESDYLYWRSFSAAVSSGIGSSVRFEVGNGTYWTVVPANGSLSSYQGRVIHWRASLSTTDGLFSPAIFRIQIIYDFQGIPAVVRISPGGSPNLIAGVGFQFHASVLDAGSHVLSKVAVAWSTTDPSGHVDNSGAYVPGSTGSFYVNASAVGWPVSASVVVHVTGFYFGLWPYFVIIGVVAALGYAGYEIMVRRLFAIDDVFLIARDGRLMNHNTRRMIADRDEDMLSGMLTAINSFVRDSWKEENSHLRRFDFGGKTALIEKGEHVSLAAVYSGRVPGWAARDLRAFMGDLELRFGSAFESWDGSPDDLQKLRDVMARFASRLRYRRRRVWNGFSA